MAAVVRSYACSALALPRHQNQVYKCPPRWNIVSLTANKLYLADIDQLISYAFFPAIYYTQCAQYLNTYILPPNTLVEPVYMQIFRALNITIDTN